MLQNVDDRSRVTVRINDLRIRRAALKDQIASKQKLVRRLDRLTRIDNENNEREQKRQYGKPLMFGDNVQLKHKYTDEFVTFDASETSLLEYNTMRVTLQPNSDRSCFFRLMPKFKVRAEGDHVMPGDQVVFISDAANGYSITRTRKSIGDHDDERTDRTVAVRFQEDIGSYEVCLAAESKGWVIDTYTAAESDCHLRIHGGDFIQLEDRELDGHLSAAKMITPTHSHDKTTLKAGNPEGTFAAFLNKGVDADGGLMHESASYWQIELYNHKERGDAIEYDHQEFLLRHADTGAYLAVDGNGLEVEGSEQFRAYLVEPDRVDGAACTFAFSAIRSGTADALDEHVRSREYSRLRHVATNSYFYSKNSALGMVVKDLFDQLQARDGKITKTDAHLLQESKDNFLGIGFKREVEFQDCLMVSRVREADADDFAYAHSLKSSLENVVRATCPDALWSMPSLSKLRAEASDRGVRVASGKYDYKYGPPILFDAGGDHIVKHGIFVLQALADFLVCADGDAGKIGRDYKEARYKRQGLLQDMGLIELVVQILKAPLHEIMQVLPIELRGEKSRARFPELQLGESDSVDPVTMAGSSGSGLWESACDVLLKASWGDATSTDRFIAQYYDVFCTHMMYLKTKNASDLLVELFEGNRDIIDDLLDDAYGNGKGRTYGVSGGGLDWILNHLNLDVNGIVDHEFWNFIAAVCVCSGLAVSRAQKKVWKMLQTGDAFNFLHRLGNFVRLTSYPDKAGQGMVIGFIPREGDAPLGLNRLDEEAGNSSIIQVVPGDDSNPSEAVTYTEVSKHSSSNKSAIAESRLKYEFLLSNLNICRALCTNHSRVPANLIIPRLISEEVLFELVFHEKKTGYALPYDLRAVIMELVHALYVDVEGAMTIFDDDLREFVYPWNDAAAAKLGAPVATASMAEALGSRAKYLNGASQASLGFLEWFSKSASTRGGGSGFSIHLYDFSWQMKHLIASEGDLKTWHRDHGTFVDACLQQMYTFISGGLVKDERHARAIVETLVLNLLVFIPYLVTGEDLVAQVDVDRQEIIASVLQSALNIIELLEIQAQDKALEELYNDFRVLFNGNEKGYAAAGDLKEIAGLKCLLFQTKEKESIMPAEAARFSAFAFTSAQRDIVTAYLRKVSNRGGSSSILADIDVMLKVAVSSVKTDSLAAKLRSVEVKRRRESIVTFREKQQDKNDVSDKAWKTTFSDLLMHVVHRGRPLAKSNVVMAAMKVVWLRQSMTTSMCLNGVTLRILVDQESLEARRVAYDILPELHYLVYYSQVHEEEAGRILGLLQQLKQLLAVSKGNKYSVKEVLFRMNLLTVVLGFFDQELDDNDTLAADINILQMCMIHALEFIGAMTEDHTEAQERMFDEMQKLLDNESVQTPRIMGTLCKALRHVFVGNPKNQVSIREQSILTMVDKLCKFRHNGSSGGVRGTRLCEIPFLLQALAERHIDLTGSTPSTRNQNLVIAEMMKQDELVADMETACRLPQRYIPISPYHLSIISLLATLADGEDEHIESICEKLVTINQLLSYLGKTSAARKPMPREIIEFLYQVYLSENCVFDVDLKYLMANENLWSVTAELANDLRKELPDLDNLSTRKYIFGVVLPLLKQIFSLFLQMKDGIQMTGGTMGTQRRGQAVVNFISSAVEQAVAIITTYNVSFWWNKGHLEVCKEFIVVALQKARPPSTTDIQFQEILDKVPDPWPKRAQRETSQEDMINQAFSSFTATLWEVYANQNADCHECHAHGDDGVVRNPDCLYIERDDDGKTALPCGDEFRQLMKMFDGEIESESPAANNANAAINSTSGPSLDDSGGEEAGYVALLRYLGFLEDAMTDISVSADERERAEVLCMSTLDMLKALLQKFRCEEQKDGVIQDPTGVEGRKITEQLSVAQTAHAKAGAITWCVKLICAEEEDLMKSAFRYMMMLTYGGNMEVQAELVRALQDSKTSICLHRIREELSRGVGALAQLVKGDAHNLVADATWKDLMPSIEAFKYADQVKNKTILLQTMVDKMTTVDNWTPVRSVDINAIVHSERSFVGFNDESIAFVGFIPKTQALEFRTRGRKTLMLTQRLSGFWVPVGQKDVAPGSPDMEKRILMKKGCATWGSSSTPAKGSILEDVWEEEYRWVMDLAEGVQQIAEGAYDELQNILRDNSSLGGDQSVNVLVELVRILAIVYPNIGSEKGSSDIPHGWLKLTKQLLDTISEICQGNQQNQQEVLDERVVSMLNAIIAHDTDDLELLELLTQTKRSAFGILKAMTEQSNATAHAVATSLLSLLNMEELYLAMNRFYYIEMFVMDGDSGLEGKHSSPHLKAGREAYQIFARLRDLTGFDPLPWKESTKHTDMTEIAKLDWEEKRNAEIQSVDSKIWEKFEELWDEYWDSYKDTPVYIADKFEESSDRAKVAKFKMFAENFLDDLDDHGSANLTNDADRRDFFEISTMGIEFVRHGNVQRLYFEAPTTTLSKTVREMTLDKLDLGSPQEKVRSFLEILEELGTGLRLQKWLRKRFLTRQISEGTGPYWQYGNLVLSYIVNMLLLASYAAPCTFVAGSAPTGEASALCHTESYSDPDNESWFESILIPLGYVHFLSSAVIVAEFSVNNLPGMVKFVRVNGPWATGLPDFKFATVLTTLSFAFQVVYYTLFLGLSGLGLWGKIGESEIPVRSVYAFHLLHLLSGNQYLSRGVSAITQNTSELLMLVLLMLSVLYIFSLLAFHFFRHDFDEESGQFCSTLAECFVTTITFGVTHGGGLREVLSAGDKYGFFGDPHYKVRVAVDLFFWMIISTIMMNLLLGIIVDTFGRLRTEEANQNAELSGFCYICSLPSHSFEHVGGFQKHIKRDHNMWAYLYFVEQLKKIEKVDMSYQERYLYDHLVEGGTNMGIKVFPIKQALELQDAHDDTTIEGKFESFAKIVGKLQQQLTDLHSYVHENFEEQAMFRKRKQRMQDFASKSNVGEREGGGMMSPRRRNSFRKSTTAASAFKAQALSTAQAEADLKAELNRPVISQAAVDARRQTLNTRREELENYRAFVGAASETASALGINSAGGGSMFSAGASVAPAVEHNSPSGNSNGTFTPGSAAEAQPEENSFGFPEGSTARQQAPSPEDMNGYLDLMPEGPVVSAPSPSVATSQLVARRQALDDRRAELENRRRQGESNRF